MFSAPDDDGILRQVAQHAQRDHDLTEISPGLIEAVRQNITTAAA